MTTSRSMAMAMCCAAAVTAQFVSGKATRDALFLTSLSFTTLPTMLMGTAVFSIALVAVYGKVARRVVPSKLVPSLFVASGVLFIGEWLTRAAAPAAAAVLVYLHISGAGPLLASGFWLIVSERFDPRSAKTGFGRIAAAGTVGGLGGALLSERVAALLGVPAMLLVLAGIQFVTASLVWLLSARTPQTAFSAHAAHGVPVPSRSGLRVVAEAPHLRQLALLVLLGTTGAALLEYLFKAKAVETFGPGDNLLRFFAFYYAAISLITFVLQASSSRAVLERFGVALTTSTPSIALLAGSIASLVAPGFGGLVVARAGESVFRGSWFRAGYELFYTPVPPNEKRAAKSVIDVTFDRLGEAVGGGLVRIAVVFLPAAQSATILSLAVTTSIAAIIVASSLNRWYLRTLESSLLDMARGLDMSPTRNESLQSRMRTLAAHDASKTIRTVSIDPEVQAILWLRSRNRERAIEVLARADRLPAGLVSYVIPLLAWEPVAQHAAAALRAVADERVGELSDVLLDRNQPDTIRRRVARVLSVCLSQRAADSLVWALDDLRFDVRVEAARSLAAIRDRNSRTRIDEERIYAAVLREAAPQTVAHVFTLLSLVLPKEPIRAAFRSLRTDDARLRGTALEYLEGVLPPHVRQGIWPFLADPGVRPSIRNRETVVARLLRSAPTEQ